MLFDTLFPQFFHNSSTKFPQTFHRCCGTGIWRNKCLWKSSVIMCRIINNLQNGVDILWINCGKDVERMWKKCGKVVDKSGRFLGAIFYAYAGKHPILGFIPSVGRQGRRADRALFQKAYRLYAEFFEFI